MTEEELQMQENQRIMDEIAIREAFEKGYARERGTEIRSGGPVSPFNLHPANMVMGAMGAKHGYLPPPLNAAASVGGVIMDKVQGSGSQDPALDSLGGGESCEEGGICGTVKKMSPFNLHPANMALGAMGATNGHLPPPLNALVSGGEALVKRVKKAVDPDKAASQQQAKESKSLRAEVNQQVESGDKGGAGRTPDAPKKKVLGTTNKYAPDSVTIGKGDTMWAIAKQYGIPLEDLMALNSDIDPRRMKIGTALRLREAPPAAAPADEGPSLLAQKIAAANAKGNPSAMEAVSAINVGNPYNGGIQDALSTAGNYIGAVGGGVAGAGRNFLANLLRRPATQPAAAVRPTDTDLMMNAERMYRGNQAMNVRPNPYRAR